MMDEALGTDIRIEDGDFVTNPTGDIQLVTGKACVAQDIKHKLMSSADALFLHPGWGADLVRFIHAANDPLNRLDLQQAVQEALERDPRVEAGTAAAEVLSWERDHISIRATCRIIGETNPLNLVIDLSGGEIRIEVI